MPALLERTGASDYPISEATRDRINDARRRQLIFVARTVLGNTFAAHEIETMVDVLNRYQIGGPDGATVETLKAEFLKGGFSAEEAASLARVFAERG
jgi:ribosomal 50S subunit-associated protein YjgA (DUF615 family)